MSGLNHEPTERRKIVLPGRQRVGAGPRKNVSRDAVALIKQGLTNAQIQAQVTITGEALVYWRRVLAEGDLSEMPCPDWVWPENRTDYRRLVCLPICDEGGRQAADRWARQEQVCGRKWPIPAPRAETRADAKAGRLDARLSEAALILLPKERHARDDFAALLRAGYLKPALALASVATGVAVDALTAPTRRQPVIKARQIYYWVARTFTLRSLPEISRLVGNCDHTAALYGVRRVAHVIEGLPDFDASDPTKAARALWAADWPTGNVLKIVRRQR